MTVGGNVTVDAGTITVVGGTMTVGGNVTVDAGTITVVGGTMTVGGSVTVSGGTITVVGGTMTVISGTISALIAGNGFFSLSAALNGVGTDTSFVFTTSAYRTQTFYVYNSGALSVSARIQISPVNNETYFINDKTAEIQLGTNQATVLTPGYFLNFTRLRIQGSNTATCLVYFNAQF
jgi:uncharacterized protein with beta-barrel porin domain